GPADLAREAREHERLQVRGPHFEEDNRGQDHEGDGDDGQSAEARSPGGLAPWRRRSLGAYFVGPDRRHENRVHQCDPDSANDCTALYRHIAFQCTYAVYLFLKKKTGEENPSGWSG